MGIGGSGLAGIAQIAKAYGFQVTGCDIAAETSYLKKVTDAGIPVFLGHDPAHLKKTEILAVSPAIFYQNDDHPETALGRKRKILMKWQEFMGTYLHRGKFVICIAGTHGKSTTTALAGHLLETADLDPTVEIGATDPIWLVPAAVASDQAWICYQAFGAHEERRVARRQLQDFGGGQGTRNILLPRKNSFPHTKTSSITSNRLVTLFLTPTPLLSTNCICRPIQFPIP
ncbi:MAG: UDP-N-acetylmuramate-L-alanine ligase [Candidatus Amesbacteria bacterium GW2011_GWC1_48_10]|uniref:UDP-N-acetylmuramate-L-alanine ligase n=1 Tax=Candidatus Amesbacteria bacterium GW2011_GWC1_48_10 TaxID=1618365 RepID=A0A0G1XHA5_9BACT|nr:MAG: UDP-N-acetylmuramate-L-alanine ligase [Candidatus Amesbacteria bacterium GW2011_GWC1_48_10]